MSRRSDLGGTGAQAHRTLRPGWRAGQHAPATAGAAIASLLLAGTSVALHGLGGPAAVQLVGSAHAATVTHGGGSTVALARGFRLERGDVVSTGPAGGVTLDAGSDRLFVGSSSQVVVDSRLRWTLRSGRVGIASSPTASAQPPTVQAGGVSVAAAPGSGVRVQRSGSVRAAALRGTAAVLAGGQTVHLATLREVSLVSDTVAVPQLVQSLDDSPDGVDAQLAPELVALDTALTRLVTQVGADPRAAELFGAGPLSAGDVALEDALRRLAGPRIYLVSAGPTGRIAWGILAAQAGADDAQVRAYVGAVLDGTTPAPTSQPVVGTLAGPPAVSPAASPAPAPDRDGPSAPARDGSSTAPSRDTGGSDAGAPPPPPATVAATTSPPDEADSPAPPAPTTTAPATDAPTTTAPATDAPTTTAPGTDAPTTDPTSAQPDGAAAEPQSDPQVTGAAAAAGPLGMLVVLARGVRGPGSSTTPAPQSGPGSTPAPSVRPSARPNPSASATPRPAASRGTPGQPRKSLPTGNRAVPSTPPVSRATPPAARRPTVPVSRAPTAPPSAVPKPAATRPTPPVPVPTTSPATAVPVTGPVGTLLCPVLGPGSLCGRNRGT